MQSFRRTNRRNAFFSRGFSFPLLIGGVFLLVLLVLRVFVPDAFTFLASPFWYVGNSATNAAGALGALTQNPARLSAERDALREENLALGNQNQALMEQVADLTRLVGTRTEPGNDILAAVIVRPPVAAYDSLVIDVGTEAGVVRGALVTGQGGVPLGTVEELGARSSRVVLFSQSGRETPVWVGENRVPLTLIGQGAGTFTAEVPHDSGILAGDALIFEADEAPIGRVLWIESDPSAPLARVRITPAANIFSLPWVAVRR